jgi:glycosyltransferase involved in cell wall biosynthesis
VAAEPGCARPLRVALLEPAGRGGIHQYTRALAAALARSGLEILLATARDHEFAGRDASDPPPFRIAPLFERWRSSPRAILSALRAFRPDVVHLQAGTHPLLHLGLLISARLATGARTVVTAHDLVPKNATRLGALASGMVQRASDRIVVHGESLARELARRVRAVAGRIRVVPHGESSHLAAPAASPGKVDATSNASLDATGAATIAAATTGDATDDGGPTILFFGYLHEEKGLPDLIEALPDVVARSPTARLVVAGRPEIDVAPLKFQAERLGVADRIEWRLGYVEATDVAPLFERARLVVLPYRAASQSGVVFLAGAFERPLVATRVGALPEVIDDGRTGRLVSPGAPRELAAAISELLSDPLRARNMGRAHARRCRGEGCWSSIAERTAALYAELLAERRVEGGGEPLAAFRAGEVRFVARP